MSSGIPSSTKDLDDLIILNGWFVVDVSESRSTLISSRPCEPWSTMNNDRPCEPRSTMYDGSFSVTRVSKKATKIWIVDSGATKHVGKDHIGFIEYYWFFWKASGLTLEVEVKESTWVEIYQLSMRTGRSLIQYDIQYAPRIRRTYYLYFLWPLQF